MTNVDISSDRFNPYAPPIASSIEDRASLHQWLIKPLTWGMIWLAVGVPILSYVTSFGYFGFLLSVWICWLLRLYLLVDRVRGRKYYNYIDAIHNANLQHVLMSLAIAFVAVMVGNLSAATIGLVLTGVMEYTWHGVYTESMPRFIYGLSIVFTCGICWFTLPRRDSQFLEFPRLPRREE
jgi:hypothetical protein